MTDISKDDQRNIDRLIFLVRVAEQAEKYDDMCDFLCDLIKLHLQLMEDFSVEERNLISVGFKNHIGRTQSAIRIISAINMTPKYRKYGDVIPDFKQKLIDKQKGMSTKYAILIKDSANKVASTQESMAFLQKLQADYWRYAIEAVTESLKDEKAHLDTIMSYRKKAA